jgi:hypothetical protein
MMGELPGVGHVGRYVFAYPGAKQIAVGIGKGTKAAYESIRGKLQAATEATEAAGAGDATLLDDIAQSQAGKKFANLDADQQAAVRSLAARVSQAGAPAEQPAPSQPKPVPMAARAASTRLPPSRQIAAPPPPPIITEPPTDTSTVRAVEPGRTVARDPATGRMKRVYTSEERGELTPVEEAFEPAPQPKAATPGPKLPPEGAYPIEGERIPGKAATGTQYEKAARTVKARALARFLNLGGISVEDAGRMNTEHWSMAAKGAGVRAPSGASIAQVIDELKRLQQNPGSAFDLAQELQRGQR